MPTLGGRLKGAREAKKVTIEQAHKDTRISVQLLYAFEDNRFDALSPTYVKSFLSKYSKYLGLDDVSIVREYAASHPEPPKVLLEPETPESKIAYINFWPAAIVIGVVISALVIYFVSYKFIVSMASKAAPKQALASSASPAVKPTKKSAAQKPSEERPFPVIAKNSTLKLRITASENAWLQVKSDGNIIFQDVLAKGSIKKVDAHKNIELWTGKAQALALDLNGHNIGSPGAGIIKGLQITHEGIKRRGNN